jgi:hypothetical protein
LPGKSAHFRVKPKRLTAVKGKRRTTRVTGGRKRRFQRNRLPDAFLKYKLNTSFKSFPGQRCGLMSISVIGPVSHIAVTATIAFEVASDGDSAV